MKNLKQYWSNLRSSFWFLPTLILAGSILLAVGLIEVDATGTRQWTERWPRVFGAGADGARGMLSTIAGSMMTVVGVTFSMTLVTLTLASSQYTSRILRNFMRDRVTQVVLGVFAGIFIFCLIVLRTIRGGDEGGFVPNLAVSVGVVMAIGGIGVLIFFIHHIASSIQASSIIASVAEETLLAVDRLFPGRLGHEASDDESDEAPLPHSGHRWQAILAHESGYIQSVDSAAFLRLAGEHQTVLRMEYGIGDFVVQETRLASLALDNPPDEAICAEVQSAYSINRYRTVEQDVSFGIRQLVDIALRALSSGINDTTTAVTCLDYLTVILARVGTRSIPSRYRSKDGELRVIAHGPTFASLVDESFDQIRASAGDNIAILLRTLDALQTLGGLTPCDRRRRVLRDHLGRTAEVADRTIQSPSDRTRFEKRLAQLAKELEADPRSMREVQKD